MSEILKITEKPLLDEDIVKPDYHSVQNKDLYILHKIGEW